MLMVEMLARMPDLRRRIQAEHLADSTGHCRDCQGAQWPCELYRLATEVDRRYGPCHSTSWGTPPPRSRPGSVPEQANPSWPSSPPARLAAVPPARATRRSAAPPPGAQPPGARSADVRSAGARSAGARSVDVRSVDVQRVGTQRVSSPRLPSGVPSLPPARSTASAPVIAGAAGQGATGRGAPGQGAAGRAAGQPSVALPIPRTTTGTFPVAGGPPPTPTALSARHDELRTRREQHQARRDELRARRGGGQPRDGGRHDLGRPYGNHPAGTRLPNNIPQPKGELIDVLEDVLRWTQ